MKVKNHNGVNYLVLTRKKGKNTEKCPFCNSTHIHGAGDGHRVAHCATEKRKEFVVIDGIKLMSDNGYFIETL